MQFFLLDEAVVLGKVILAFSGLIVICEMITNQLRNLEQELTLPTHALDYFINETEIRIAGKKLKNLFFSDKNEMINPPLMNECQSI